MNLDRHNPSVEGKLIVLEGIDAALLAAQSERLCRWLQGLGLEVEQTAEPTYGPVGAQIRLAELGRLRFEPHSLALLWVAERLDHQRREDGILSWLAEGRHVLCARSLLYAYARQWVAGRNGQDVDWEWLRRIHAPCRPADLTLYLDTPPTMVRDDSPAALEPLYEGYREALERLRREGEPIERIDGRGTPVEIGRTCRQHVADTLGLPGSAAEERGGG